MENKLQEMLHKAQRKSTIFKKRKAKVIPKNVSYLRCLDCNGKNTRITSKTFPPIENVTKVRWTKLF